jgi:hypothetical protein
MSKQPKSYKDCSSFEELKDIVSFDEVWHALDQVEKNRVYHKNAYLKRQDRVKRALALLERTITEKE